MALNTQGVNLGFGDVASLASCVEDSLREGGRLGQREYLAQYETERQEGGQAWGRVTGSDKQGQEAQEHGDVQTKPRADRDEGDVLLGSC